MKPFSIAIQRYWGGTAALEKHARSERFGGGIAEGGQRERLGTAQTLPRCKLLARGWVVVGIAVGGMVGAGGCSRFNGSPMPPMTPPVVEFGPAVPQYNLPQLPAGGAAIGTVNPLRVAVSDREVAWDTVVDAVDDFFKIEREERVKLVGDILTEGQITTFPQSGATLLEPWREDSVNFTERLESTLQSIRRRATVRVVPEAEGYLIDVVVLKELEDVPRPMHATAGGATFRYDTALDDDTEAEPILGRQVGDAPRPVANPQPTAGWIAQGRDTALEQAILFRIQERLQRNPTVVAVPPPISAQTLTAPVQSTTPPSIGLPPDNVVR